MWLPLQNNEVYHMRRIWEPGTSITILHRDKGKERENKKKGVDLFYETRCTGTVKGKITVNVRTEDHSGAWKMASKKKKHPGMPNANAILIAIK